MQAAFLAKSLEADELRRELAAERSLAGGQQAELEEQMAAMQRQLEQSEERVRTGEALVGRMSTYLKGQAAGGGARAGAAINGAAMPMAMLGGPPPRAPQGYSFS